MTRLRKLILIGALAGAWAAPVIAETITVTGHGTVATAPDLAMVSLGVVLEADTAAEALAAVSAQMRVVMDNLANAGITGADIQTSGLRLNPRYDNNYNGQPRANGYEAGLEVAVRVRDLDQLGVVLDAAVKDGVNQFNGVTFDVADPAPHLKKARIAAIEDARLRAETYAGAAGAGLGKIESIIESGGTTQPIMMDARAEMAMSSVPIAQGEVGISADVTVVWTLTE